MSFFKKMIFSKKNVHCIDIMTKNNKYYKQKYTKYLQERQLRMFPQIQEVEIQWSWMLAKIFSHNSIYLVRVIMRLISFIDTDSRFKQDRQIFEQMQQKIYEQIRLDREIRTLLSKQGYLNSSSIRCVLVTEPLLQKIDCEPHLTWSCTCHKIWRIRNVPSLKYPVNLRKIQIKTAFIYKTPKLYNYQDTVRYAFKDITIISWFFFTFYHNNQTYMGQMSLQSKELVCCGKTIETWNDYGGGWIQKSLPFDSNLTTKFVNNLKSCFVNE